SNKLQKLTGKKKKSARPAQPRCSREVIEAPEDANIEEYLRSEHILFHWTRPQQLLTPFVCFPKGFGIDADQIAAFEEKPASHSMGSSQSTSVPDSRIVETEYGKVQGRRLISEGDRQVDAFQGIPFAKAPVGELRFKKPQPPDRWDDIFDARKWGPRAVQKDVFTFGLWKSGPKSEDCLRLNVFTPCWIPPEGGFAVMVFVHGGGFAMGDASVYGDRSICETLCLKDVVVVTIQYRLGYLGFWTTGDAACPSNLGLWDQTAALQWIQLNIEAFGGNKDNVTVMGQSAGGVSVDLLAISPHSTGLFHKVIPMGGCASAKWAFAPSMKKVCERRAKKVKIQEWSSSENLMEQLRALPSSAFEISMFGADLIDGADLECTPVIDGDFLPSSVDELRKSAPAKPMMTGVAKLEALMFLLMVKKTAGKVRKAATKAVPETVPNREEEIENLIREYIDLDTVKGKKAIHRALHEVHSDFATNAATLKMIKDTLAAQPGNPVYSYVFSYLNPKSYGPLRWYLSVVEATHGMELPYLFGKALMLKFDFNEKDREMCDIFSTAFTNFAKYGNPNGPVSSSTVLPVEWEAASIEHSERHYIFDKEFRNEDSYFNGRPSKLLQLRELTIEEQK
ncbi:hypothetical protein PMAYCL1PPCAC_13083, partial [Pristionchus mayeri]